MLCMISFSKRIENQIKSYFTNLEKIDLTIDENIRIFVIDENNVDPPSIEIKQVKKIMSFTFGTVIHNQKL